MMAKTEAAASRQEQRVERRQAQILDAARACVRADGFHAASMSRIAAEAGMSVGHIYQYFENKEAIMVALSERDFEDFMFHVTELGHHEQLDVPGIIAAFQDRIMWLLDHDRAALALEVLAESARNAKFASLVLRVDREFRHEARKIVRTAVKGLLPAEADARVEMLLVVVRALLIHAGTHPVSDRKLLADGFGLALRGLLGP
ncbi:TetR/AcrR family transcriptional regulator [Sphingobium tyrosinilyticum]|uniref:TetR/AcrR family transcriptional regulator n=1 Tax=Sphingobium tyrosinilyticum TaxID=2715436 RepID=A0ABV9F2Q2_9SPHN